MWAETVDPSDLHNTVWPRAAAVAEVLWTPLDVIYPNGIAVGTFLFLSVVLICKEHGLWAGVMLIMLCRAFFQPYGTHVFAFPPNVYENVLLLGTDLARAEDRLETFRCLLTRRGISAAPVTNTQARYQPKEPNSCFVQRRRL